jgi:hypothetical protein
MLSRMPGQVIHALLTRAPLDEEQAPHPVRLACVKRAASVRSEPGSNSPVYPAFLLLKKLLGTHLRLLFSYQRPIHIMHQ